MVNQIEGRGPSVAKKSVAKKVAAPAKKAAPVRMPSAGQGGSGAAWRAAQARAAQSLARTQPQNTNISRLSRQGGIPNPVSNSMLYTNPATRAPTPGSSSDIAVIMQRSGSTDPSDPYNWRGIAANLAAQESATNSAASYSGGISGSGGGGGGSSYSAPAPQMMAAPSVYQTQANQAPTGVAQTSAGSVGAPSGLGFRSVGAGGTFGQFDRKRNARQPRTGLSVTPELLRRSAQARLGSM